MSLQVWLPLNGNLNNNGINNTAWNNSGAVVSSNGKIGSCYAFTYTSHNQINYSGDVSTFMNTYINHHSFTLAIWAKVGTGTRTPLFGLTYGLEIEGNVPQFTLYNTTAFKYVCANTAINDGKWHHVCGTYSIDTNIASIYIDGVLENTMVYSTDGTTYASSWTNTMSIGRDQNNSTDECWFDGSLNDVRIYDHCLSEKEVEELAKGLCLHYKLNDGYMEPTVNYGYPPKLYSSTYSPGWDTTLHLNAVTVTGWGGGYNGGVSNPTTGYHAMWNIIDNIPTMVFQNHNSIISQKGRWLGISSSTLSYAITAGVKYTISYEQRSIDNLGGYTTCGRYYKYTSSGSKGFHDGCPTIGKNTILGTWQKFSYTFTGNSSIDGTGTNGNIYVYGHYGTESTMQVRNLQVEIKDHATPYTSSTRDLGLVYDSSGYGYNGTPNSTLQITSDTARYTNATNWIDSASSITIGNLSTIVPDGIFTFNIWFKKETGKWSSKSYETILGGPSGFELEGKPSSSNTNKIRLYSWGGSDGSKDFTYPLDQWNMLTMVRNSSGTIWYLNGEQVQTASAGSIPSGTYFLGAWSTAEKQNYLGKMSDARIYATNLTATQIKELYNTSASIDNQGNIHVRELIEN